MAEFQEYLFGIPISTHRNRESFDFDVVSPFPYEFVIAAIAICFFRTAIYQKFDKTRWFFGIVLGFLAYSRKSYELICAVELFSYAVPYIVFTKHLIPYNNINSINKKQRTTTTTNKMQNATTKTKQQTQSSKKQQQSTTTTTTTTTTNDQDHDEIIDYDYSPQDILIRISLIALSATMSLILSHVVATGVLFRYLSIVTPNIIQTTLASGLPIQEITAAYQILDRFIYEDGLLKSQVYSLFFTTFHIQCGIGYLGINFLKQEQERRNQLVRMDIDDTTTTTTATTTTDQDSNNSNNDNGTNKPEPTNNGKTDNNTTTNNSVDNKASSTAATTTTTTTNNNHKLQKSKRFQRSAGPFIFFTAVPYMIQIIFYGNLNAFAFACFKDDIHRAIRLYDLFEHDNNLVALAEHSAKSPAAFAGYMDVIVDTTYDLFNRKLFSLPKVLLLPMVMARQPKMMVQIFPIIFFTDWLKGRAVAYMTNRIEQLEKETQEIVATRSKVEAFDMKNAELLQRAGAGATEFTRRRWEELTVQVQMKTVAKDLTRRTKGFFAWIERNFVFSVLVDCALAHLIAVGKIVAADIFVFSRAIEDAVDMVLMKSRSEAELARMMTQITNMEELASVWDKAKMRNLLHCNLATVMPSAAVDHGGGTAPTKSSITLRNLLYSRGTALVRVDHLDLKAGIYALTGANGSGKSTLFRVLMSCETNDRPIDLPPSIVLSTPFEPIIEQDDLEREISCEDADEADEVLIDAMGETIPLSENPDGAMKEAHPRLSITMPSSHVVEISQTFYWPLYSRPIDWIFQEHVTDTCNSTELDARLRRVAEELHMLEFTQRLVVAEQEGDDESSVTESPSDDAISGIMGQLLEVKEDWFNDLSGGQRSKVELVRKVFLQDECPHVLLIDETMAPLDPRSKALVMARLKGFCSNSVVIVIYHTDVGREQEGEEGQAVECVPSNDFFDGNIHVENQGIHMRPVC